MVVVSVPDRQAQLCRLWIEKNTRIGWQFR